MAKQILVLLTRQQYSTIKEEGDTDTASLEKTSLAGVVVHYASSEKSQSTY